MKSSLTVGLAQIAPVFLDKEKTLAKIEATIIDASEQDVALLVFGEALLPGYPFWLALTQASEFNNSVQKEIHAHYAMNSVVIENGDLQGVCNLAKQYKIAMYIGVIERPMDRGGHSLYASLIYISEEGNIQSVHRKLQPTYEERLSWSPGDGNGLQVHELPPFTVGGLNCWENWMPLPRAALYGQGENLHVAVWPGSDFNTKDITRFIARESRSYVLSVSSVLKLSDIPQDFPNRAAIFGSLKTPLANGGSCIAGPDGEWIVSPVIDKEELITATLDFNEVLKERQNFDPVGHYARPDVTRLYVNRERQSTIQLDKE
ncbi:carbon-nitrogen hydrolase family protein [Aquimarina sp. 2-A2]|uniref:carbon-nitrogen hydrolase family protein n=1 Tax=Aquimarina sp. 2-A2 TaxID=3382644 RepID=UPI00387F02D6